MTCLGTYSMLDFDYIILLSFLKNYAFGKLIMQGFKNDKNGFKIEYLFS